MRGKNSRDQIKRLAEVLYTLPKEARSAIVESAQRYLAQEGQKKQLRLLFDSAASSSANAAPLPPVPVLEEGSQHRRRKIAFGWYGGKFSHLNWLLPLLPYTHHYCEPFAGSAAVLLNREPSPVETYNDIDGEVANFFRVLRDQPEELIRAIGLTPFSRREFAVAVSRPEDDLSDLERARRFFICARQVRTGLAQTASIGRWANCKGTSRAGMAGAVSRWLGSVEGLPEIALRLVRVQIENRPALEVIKLYDGKETLFYCDPPYPHETRGDTKSYRYEMSDANHAELARVLKSAKGKVAISGYRCQLMDQLYKGWRCMEAPEKNCHSIKKPRKEALWMNY
jgi:DNA adenine methylase